MVYRKVKDLEARIHMLERQRGDAARACDFAAAQLRVARKLFLRMGTGALDEPLALEVESFLRASEWAEAAKGQTALKPAQADADARR